MKPETLKGNITHGTVLRRTSSFDKTWEESVAECVANELVMNAHSSTNPPSKTVSLSLELEQPVIETSKIRSKDSKLVKTGRQFHDNNKDGKFPDDRSRPSRLTEFHNINISQVGLQ